MPAIVPNIGVEFQTLLGPQTGTVRYTSSLVRCLSPLINELNLFYNHAWHTALPEVTENQKDKYYMPAAIEYFPTLLYYYKHKKHRMLERQLRASYSQFQPDLLFCPNFFALDTGIPVITTVYDISCIVHPEFHPAYRVIWHQKMLPKSLERSSHILAISQYTKSELMEKLGIPSNKITVTTLGVSNTYKPIDSTQIFPLTESYNLQYKKYILIIGTLEPRKNIISALKAYIQLDEITRRHFPLVLSGLYGWKQSSLMKPFSKYIRSGQIKILGYVPEKNLPALYSAAAITLYPSLYEGFGLPPLESMACGTPVISSNTTSLPEAVGEAGLKLNPLDINSWTNAINELLNDSKMQDELREKGLKRAKTMTWERCAKTTQQAFIDTYQSVC